MSDKTYIIEEDEYLQNIRKIIKRDFFSNSSNQENTDEKQIQMSLSQYLSKNKSYQNQIFSELVKSDVEEFKKRNQWMEKCSKFMLQADPSSKVYQNMIGNNPELKAIDHSKTKQDARNGVFFNNNHPTKSFLSKEHDLSKKILYKNCTIDDPHIHQKVQYLPKSYHNFELQEIPHTQTLQGKSQKIKKIRMDQDRQYSLRRQQSPEPDVAPIMTWGQVQNTPARLPQYTIPQTPKRDLLLQEMNSKINKQKRIKKQKKDQVRNKILSSVRPNMSSYRKASTHRIASNRRPQNKQVSNEKLNDLLK